jgi:hypothetical protein
VACASATQKAGLRVLQRHERRDAGVVPGEDAERAVAGARGEAQAGGDLLRRRLQQRVGVLHKLRVGEKVGGHGSVDDVYKRQNVPGGFVSVFPCRVHIVPKETLIRSVQRAKPHSWTAL